MPDEGDGDDEMWPLIIEALKVNDVIAPHAHDLKSLYSALLTCAHHNGKSEQKEAMENTPDPADQINPARAVRWTWKT